MLKRNACRNSAEAKSGQACMATRVLHDLILAFVIIGPGTSPPRLVLLARRRAHVSGGRNHGSPNRYSPRKRVGKASQTPQAGSGIVDRRPVAASTCYGAAIGLGVVFCARCAPAAGGERVAACSEPELPYRIYHGGSSMFRRHSILTLCIVVVTTSLTCADAHAGCCDWLFGRTNSPYVAGYAPYGAYRYGLNAPVTSTSAYRAAYPTSAAVVAPANGVYQSQMRSYDNPSVYTGRPVIASQSNSQTSYSLPVTGTTAPLTTVAPTYASNYSGAGMFGRTVPVVPLAGRLRGPATTSNPFYGTGNLYPQPPTPQAATSGVYQSAYPPVTTSVTTVPTGLPPSALPAAPVAPLFSDAPQPRVGGLARFFGSRLGTNYRSSYYRAPVTYYRPVTSVDPVSGTTVTVQQPCTSYVQQLQRTPYSSLQPGLAAPPVVPPTTTPGCQTSFPGYAAAPLGASSVPITPYGGSPLPSTLPSQPAAIGQVGGYSSTNDRLVVPIPSTDQPGYYQQPGGAANTAPLTGAAAADSQPVDQPRLESNRPSDSEPWWQRDDATTDSDDESNPSNESAGPSSYLQQLDFDDRTVRNAGPNDHSVRQVQSLTDVRPIAAPEGFENPFQQRSQPQPAGQQGWDRSATPVHGEPSTRELVAPPLPPAETETRYGAESYSASIHVSAPVREAKLRKPAIRLGSPATDPAPPKRDDTWYSSK